MVAGRPAELFLVDDHIVWSSHSFTGARTSRPTCALLIGAYRPLAVTIEGQALRTRAVLVGPNVVRDVVADEAGFYSLTLDPAHPACRDLPSSFGCFDEIYEFENWQRNSVHALLSMHHHPQSGQPGDFPVARTRRHGNGRMFYTSLGHREDGYAAPIFRNHLAGGILWALGLESGNDAPGNPVI